MNNELSAPEDIYAVDLEAVSAEGLPDDAALASFSTGSTAGTASCPSSVSTLGTVGCAG
ncbi:thiocillin family RiPP [Paeniglutamicibacter gangotriensis]|uniref:Thiocillin family RiPP n=1 Tax=Paeniglutamicibacter gangotriensis Lz1y TaxID=1276920 RepID=M7MZN7_9MICC|nr:thiocillin family RiPP [Paeniglutamicibacter gangotriensis]EMR00416.1 hypothetical protein ADIAG_00423 [Paeniglutamicibacter gangotriensis Lz1y]